MGLDQYLYASKSAYQSDWDKSEKGDAQRNAITAIKEAIGATNFPVVNIGAVEVNIEVAYWRKANQVHHWFVQECGGGEDNCQKMWVSRDHLINLKGLCEEVLEDNSKAEELLPPQMGFFFGSYEIDEYYFDDLKNTVEQIDNILSFVPEDWDFEYQASW